MHRWVLRMSAATGHSFVSSGLPPTDRKFKGHYRASSTLGQGSSRLITLPHRPRPYARRPTPQAASSNSSCRSIRAGAMGGTLDGSPTPSRYPRTDAPAVSAAMMETVGLCIRPPQVGHTVTSTWTVTGSAKARTTGAEAPDTIAGNVGHQKDRTTPAGPVSRPLTPEQVRRARRHAPGCGGRLGLTHARGRMGLLEGRVGFLVCRNLSKTVAVSAVRR